MKKTILWTLLIGLIVIITVCIAVPQEKQFMLLFAYAYFPISFLAVAYGLSFAGVSDSAWISTVVNSPFFIGLAAILLLGENEYSSQLWPWICRLPLFTILLSIIILEYKLFKIFGKKKDDQKHLRK